MKKRNGLFSIQETAKLTKFPGGEIKFFRWLRDKGYLLKDNQPYQKYRDKEWFELETATIHKSNPKLVVLVTLVTIKGLAGLEKVVHKEFPCDPYNRQG
jgi:phage antirepressor YoqD-like protein